MAGQATTALTRAYTGESDAPKKNPNVVSKAVFNKLQEAFDRKDGKLAKMAKQGKEAGAAVLEVLETGGTALLYGAVKGGFGDENTSIGDVPVGGVLGVGLIGWGLYDIISGDGGSHQCAVGTGLLASDLSDLGRKAGAAAREKWQDKKDGLPTDTTKTPPPAVDTTAPATVKLAGGVRELEVGRSGRRRRADDEDLDSESWWRKQGRKRGRSGDKTHSIAPIRVLTMSGDGDGDGEGDDDFDGDFDD